MPWKSKTQQKLRERDRSQDSRLVDPDEDPVSALKQLDAQSVDGAVPTMCTEVRGDSKQITFEFRTIHKETFTKTVTVPNTLEDSKAKQLIEDELGYEIQNLDMIEGEWFYAREGSDGWSFYDPPSGITGRVRHWFSAKYQSLQRLMEGAGTNQRISFTDGLTLVLAYIVFWWFIWFVAPIKEDWDIWWWATLCGAGELLFSAAIVAGLLF